MARIAFDIDVLRSFVTGVELGSFAKAAERLGRSTSAVSAQLKKLEEQVGAPILRKAGRGLVLTTLGETVLAYARRLLILNDEAAAAVRGADLEGWIRLGLQEDFGERVLTDILGRFARAHPNVQIEVHVARSGALIDRVESGNLDMALAWDGSGGAAHAQQIGQVALQWIGPAEGSSLAEASAENPLPLVAFEAPCLMRLAATTALDRAGIAWRLAFTSASLSGIWAAVAAGLGITVRTAIGLPGNLQILDPAKTALPGLPTVGLSLYSREAKLAVASERLKEIILASVFSMSGTGLESERKKTTKSAGNSIRIC